MKKHQKTSKSYLTLIIVFSIPLFYFIVTLIYASNIPAFDEYRTMILAYNEYEKAEGFKQVISYLFIPENESIQLFLKVWMAVDVFIEGSLNFSTTILIGNLFLVLLSLLIYKLLNEEQQKNIWILIPAFLIFYNFQYFLITLRADTSFYYFSGLYFAFLSFYFFVKKKTYAISIGLLIFSTFCNASSILIYPLYLIHLSIEKKWSKIFYLLVSFICTLYLFSSVSSPFVDQRINHFEFFIPNYLMTLGSPIMVLNISNKWIAIAKVFGLGILITSIYIIIKNFVSKNQRTNLTDFISLVLSFSLLFLAAIVYKRGGLQKLDNIYLLHSRYHFYATIPLTFVVLYFSRNFSIHTYWGKALLIGSFVFSITSTITSIPGMNTFRKGLQLDAIFYPKYKLLISDQANNIPIRNFADSVLIKNSFYTYKTTKYFKNLYRYSNTFKTHEKPLSITTEIDSVSTINQTLTIKGVLPEINSFNKGIYILLENDNHHFLYPTNNLNWLLRNLSKEKHTFYGHIYIKNLPQSGVYNIYILQDGTKQKVIYKTLLSLDSRTGIVK